MRRSWRRLALLRVNRGLPEHGNVIAASAVRTVAGKRSAPRLSHHSWAGAIAAWTRQGREASGRCGNDETGLAARNDDKVQALQPLLDHHSIPGEGQALRHLFQQSLSFQSLCNDYQITATNGENRAADGARAVAW